MNINRYLMLAFVLITGLGLKCSTAAALYAKSDSHIALISLAYQLRYDRWALDKLNKTKQSQLTQTYNKLVKEFAVVGKLPNLLPQLGHFCVLQTTQQGSVCDFNKPANHGGFLYVTPPATEDSSMLMIVSFDSPERTMIYKWNKDLSVSLQYNSFNKKKNRCSLSVDFTPLRVVRAIKNNGKGTFTFYEHGNREAEFKREILVDLQNNQCSLKTIKETMGEGPG